MRLVRFVSCVFMVFLVGCPDHHNKDDPAQLDGSAPDAAPDTATDGQVITSELTPTEKAEQFVTAPTVELVQLAESEHAPTEDEKALAAVYWAFLIHSDDQDPDPVLVTAGVNDAMLVLARQYPSFFIEGASVSANKGLKFGQIINCATDCVPDRAIIKDVGSRIFSAIKAVKGLPAAVAATRVYDTVSDALRKGTTLANALKGVLMTNHDDVYAVLDAVATIGLVTAPLVAAGTAAAEIVAIIGAGYASANATVGFC